MKKLLMAFVVCFVTIIHANAQKVVTGGFRRAGTNAQIKAMEKDKIKQQLDLTDDQAKSVDAINQDYRLKMRAIKLDTQLSEEDRKARLKELQAQRKTDLKTILSESQVAKLDGAKQHPKKSKYSKKRTSTVRS